MFIEFWCADGSISLINKNHIVAVSDQTDLDGSKRTEIETITSVFVVVEDYETVKKMLLEE